MTYIFQNDNLSGNVYFLNALLCADDIPGLCALIVDAKVKWFYEFHKMSKEEMIRTWSWQYQEQIMLDHVTYGVSELTRNS